MFIFVGGGPYSIWITIFFLAITSSDLLSYASFSWIAPLAIGIGGAYLWSKWQNNYGNWNGQENGFFAMFRDLRRDAQDWFERQRAGLGAARARGGNRNSFRDVALAVQKLPTIAYESKEVLNALTIKELRKRLNQRQIDSTGCLEKSDLLHLLHTVSGSSSCTCSICLEEYEPGDVLRFLPKCNHQFHIGCLDRWCLSAVDTQNRVVSCPLCNQPIV